MGWRACAPWAALVVIAGALRVRLLTDWLGYDECQHFLVARSGLGSGFLNEFAARAHPPLYYLTLEPFTALGHGAWLVRLPSLLAGLAAVALGHRLLRRLVGPGPAAWLGALGLGATPIFVQLSVEARGYALCQAFVMASWLAADRLRVSGATRARDHAPLAAWLGLALATEFAAIFHAAALLVALCTAPLVALLAARRFGDALRLVAPHAVVILAAGLLFAWQHQGAVPQYAHAAAGLYRGSLGDLPGVLHFVADRLPRQLDAILPAPGGALLLVLLVLGAGPLAGNRPAARDARWFARTGLLSLAFVLVAGLSGVFPFGGTPRHASPVYPGILVAGILVVLLPLRDGVARRRSLRWAAATLAIVIAVPGGVALARAGRDPRTREGLAAEVFAEHYRAAPAPIVTNGQGRSLVSWWWLPEARPARRRDGGARFGVYDYDGIPVVEAASVADAVRTAVFYAGVADASWLFLPVAPGESVERVERDVLEALDAAPEVQVEVAGRSRFVREHVTLRLTRAPAAAGAASHPGAS